MGQCDYEKVEKLFKSSIRRALRTLVYATPLHRVLGIGRTKYDHEYWNKQLSGKFKPWLGGTISVDVRNSIVLSLIDNIAPHTRRLLDAGCASGSLFRAFGSRPFSYIGIDISEFAIEEGRKQSPSAEFRVSRLEDFSPENPFDVIVLNEVLYFLPVDEAYEEAKRFAGYLAKDGILIVSMKDDPKSKAVFSRIELSLKWINGVLYQENISGPKYSIRKDAKRPAYMIGVFARDG